MHGLAQSAALLSELGDLLKQAGENAEAIRAYRRSIALKPSLAAFSGLRELDFDVEVGELPAASRAPEILVEMSDLFSDLLDNATISGIQRIQLGVISHILSEHEAGRALDCHLVWWVNDELWRLDAKSLLDVVRLYETPDVTDAAYRQKIVDALTTRGELVIPMRGDVLVLYRSGLSSVESRPE